MPARDSLSRINRDSLTAIFEPVGVPGTFDARRMQHPHHPEQLAPAQRDVRRFVVSLVSSEQSQIDIWACQ